MDLQVGAGKLDLTDLRFHGAVEIAEVQASTAAAVVRVDAAGVGLAGEIALTLTVTEAAVNDVLARSQKRPLLALVASMLDGSVRLTGRYHLAGPLAVPFELAGVLEVEGGVRLRLRAQRLAVVGTALPDQVLGVVGDRVNASLSELLDVTRLGAPLRLTRVTVEPGRATLHGVWALDAHFARPARLAVEG